MEKTFSAQADMDFKNSTVSSLQRLYHRNQKISQKEFITKKKNILAMFDENANFS